MRGTDYLGVTGTLCFSRGRVADDSTIGILVATGLGKSGQPQQCLLMYPQGDGRVRTGPGGHQERYRGLDPARTPNSPPGFGAVTIPAEFRFQLCRNGNQ